MMLRCFNTFKFTRAGCFIAALTLLSPMLSEAQVYKCTRDGETIYQETPCEESGEMLDIPLSLPKKAEPPVPVDLPGPTDVIPPLPGQLSDEDIERIVDALIERDEEAAAEEEARSALTEEPAITSCNGIRIYSAVAYDAGGQTFLQRWRTDGDFRRRFVTTPRVQCASLVVKLPGYYGDIFDTMDEDFASRFLAIFVDDEVRAGESVELPSGRVDHTARYRIQVCFGENDLPIASVVCE